MSKDVRHWSSMLVFSGQALVPAPLGVSIGSDQDALQSLRLS